MKLKTILSTLIIWFWLLSFSSAYEVVWNWWQIEVVLPDTAVIGNYVYVFNSNWNISTDNYWQYLLWYNNHNNLNLRYVYWWIDWKLYFAWFYGNDVQKQWFIQKFSVCNELEPTDSSKCLNLSISAEDFYQLNPDITELIIWATSSNLQNFYGNEPFRVCYFNSNDSLYYCVQNAIWTNWYVDNPLSDSLWFTNFSSLSNWNWWSSPFGSSSVPEWAYLDNDYNNQDVMLSWSRLWYTKNLCYSDFSITRLFDLSWSVAQIFDNDLEDWMWYGTWATVFDLYSWSSVSNFASFWSSSINRVNTMLLTNTISNYWSGRPVWQAYLSYKLNERLEWNSSFNLTDYYQFCHFALGLSDSERDSNYTWSKLPSDVESQLESEKHIRICSMSWAESSAFCGWFSAWGGAWGWWSRPASISDFYNSVFSILEARDWLNLTWDWILQVFSKPLTNLLC